MLFAGQQISEGFFKNVQPTPPVRFYLWQIYSYANSTESNALFCLTNYENCSNIVSLGKGNFIFDISDAWQATNAGSSPIGAIYDANGILQWNTNAYPNGFSNIVAQIHAQGWLAGIQIQGVNADGSSDAGLPWRGVTNIYGNVLNALTNWGFDVIFGHGSWAQSPQTVMDMDIQAELACVNSGKRAWFSPQALTGASVDVTNWNLWMPVFQRFFPVICNLSGSGYPDTLVNLAQYHQFFDYTFTNSFSTFLGPGHTFEDMSKIGGTIVKYDPVWRANKVISSMNAMLSGGIANGMPQPNIDDYGSCYFPIDVIKYVQQDPLVSWPTMLFTTNSGKVYVLGKKLQNNAYAVCTVNWDTNNATNVVWNTIELGLPQNVTSYQVHDLWSNTPDFYLAVGATYTNVLNSGDCTHYRLTPYVSQYAGRTETNWVDGSLFDACNVTATVLNALNGSPIYPANGFSYVGTGTAYMTFGIPGWATNATITLGGMVSSGVDSVTFTVNSYWLGSGSGSRGNANFPPYNSPAFFSTLTNITLYTTNAWPGTNGQQWIQIGILGTNATATRFITGPARVVLTGP
jgi:hypothetical protein